MDLVGHTLKEDQYGSAVAAVMQGWGDAADGSESSCGMALCGGFANDENDGATCASVWEGKHYCYMEAEAASHCTRDTHVSTASFHNAGKEHAKEAGQIFFSYEACEDFEAKLVVPAKAHADGANGNGPYNGAYADYPGYDSFLEEYYEDRRGWYDNCADTDGANVDKDGDKCEDYQPHWCGGDYDTASFKADQMCCVCKGGNPIRAADFYKASQPLGSSTNKVLIAVTAVALVLLAVTCAVLVRMSRGKAYEELDEGTSMQSYETVDAPRL